jgi:Na+/H+ antiporter NhaC
MSSMASTADHVDHVRTQLPYAMTVAAVCMLLGYVPAALGLPVPAVLLICLVAVFLIVRFFGKPVASPKPRSQDA